MRQLAQRRSYPQQRQIVHHSAKGYGTWNSQNASPGNSGWRFALLAVVLAVAISGRGPLAVAGHLLHPVRLHGAAPAHGGPDPRVTDRLPCRADPPGRRRRLRRPGLLRPAEQRQGPVVDALGRQPGTGSALRERHHVRQESHRPSRRHCGLLRRRRKAHSQRASQWRNPHLIPGTPPAGRNSPLQCLQAGCGCWGTTGPCRPIPAACSAHRAAAWCRWTG